MGYLGEPSRFHGGHPRHAAVLRRRRKRVWHHSGLHVGAGWEHRRTLGSFGYRGGQSREYAGGMRQRGQGLATNPSVPTSDPNFNGLAALGNYGCYMSGNSVILAPAQGTYGNMDFNVLRSQWLRVWDLAVVKNFAVKEHMTVQFRAEFFNIINAVNYSGATGSNPATPSTFGASTGTPEIISNAPVFGTGGPRKINFGAKITF